MRKILIAATNPWSYSLAVERELVRRHSADQVDAIDMVRLCQVHSPQVRPRDRLIERLNRKVDRFLMSQINGRNITGDVAVDLSSIPPAPADVTKLRHYKVGAAHVGLGVLSTLVETTTVVDARSADEYGPDYQQAWRAAHASLQVGQAVSKLGYDLVYIFGGRHCHARPFCDLLEQTCPVVKYEQGSTGTSFIETAGSVYEGSSIRLLVDAHDFDREAGEEYLRERVQRAPLSGTDFFGAMQKANHVPAGAGPGGFVAFFTCSPDEFYAARDEYRFGEFRSQHEAALAMAESCRRRGLNLFVRFHPHLRYKHQSWEREWDFSQLEQAGAIVLRPEDPCDSYALVREAHCVFATSISIGFEATYMGKVNAGLGDIWSTALGASTRVDDAAGVDAFIADPHLPEDAYDRALWYGSFMKRAGTPISDLDVGSHPNYARIDGITVDRVRSAAQRVRSLAAAVRGRPLRNKSGIVAGKVILPSGPRYEEAHRTEAG